VINRGELLLVDDKVALMHKLGKRQLVVDIEESLQAVPKELAPWGLDLSPGGSQLTYTYDPHKTHTGIGDLLRAIQAAGLSLKDLDTTQTSLEEIFVNLVNESS